MFFDYRSLQSKDTHEIADFKSHLGPENFFSKGNDPNDDEEAAGDYPDHMKRFIGSSKDMLKTEVIFIYDR